MDTIKKQIGGDRLGSGNKMTAEMRTYERSTHDLGYLWRSSMAPGTLIPFLNEIALPGDTFDINLDAEVRTHPTLGPLYGSFKLQLDIFEVPMRLYNAQLQNNILGVGLDMSVVKYPLISITSANEYPNDTSYQINPSCILAYLGIRGIGTQYQGGGYVKRQFNAMPLLAYWDIFKNYYANKQETNAYVISGAVSTLTPTSVKDQAGNVISQNSGGSSTPLTTAGLVLVYPASTTLDINSVNNILIQTSEGGKYQPIDLFQTYIISGNGGATPTITFTQPTKTTSMVYWQLASTGTAVLTKPILKAFPLKNLDDMRTGLLQYPYTSTFVIENTSITPYLDVIGTTSGNSPLQLSQQGLAVKTYQSDINNNWMQTAWVNQVATASAVSTVGNTFTIDQLNLANKVYNMLNRIAMSGGSYYDWIETVYTADVMRRAETPMYAGGLSKEVLFQEVTSMASSQTNSGTQFLGELGGKGVMGNKHKGGEVIIKVKEPSIIMGIVSLTPRIDYSQGNKWSVNLKTMNDLHKPALDQIGFQDLVTDQMAYWDTTVNNTANVNYFSAGKQPAWINYMTNVNQTYGNFAIPENEMFMTLNRRYTQNSATKHIQDLTTYIDPAKYNFIFAQTSIDAQNFWTQIAVNITARRKMSAKIMPML